MDNKVYIDYASTTYLKEEVLNEMLPYLTKYFGNPSSAHSMSREVKKAIYDAKVKVGKAVNAGRDEVFFTSGGSEANNWALKGVAFRNKDKGKHIITSEIEHHSILNTCKYLEELGFNVTYLPVDEKGIVNTVDLVKAINKDTILVSIMFANNEVGSIQKIKEIGTICKERKIIFHTDAVQAVGHIPIDVKELNIDLLSMSAHKFYGPKGIGALYVKKGTRIHNLIHGGAQERAKRSGTENVSGIVGLGKAIELGCENLEKENKRLAYLGDKLIKGLLSIPYTRLNGPTGEERLPGNVNISFKYVDGEAMLVALDNLGIYASSGSACASGSLEPSHVLVSMGLPEDILKASVRFSMGEGTTEEDIDYLISTIPSVVQRIRSLNPEWEKVM